MSIKHRAYLFDSEKYELSVKAILKQCCQTDKTDYAEKYIKDNFGKLKSPYTGEPLQAEDIERIAHADMQEHINYILTECYEPASDIGLSYMWDAAVELLKQMPIGCEAGLCVFGEEIKFCDIAVNPRRLNPGYCQPMETAANSSRTKCTEVEKIQFICRKGIIGAEKAAVIYDDLKKNRPSFDKTDFLYRRQKYQYYVKNKLPRLYLNQDILYDLTIEELSKTYSDLLNIYKQAKQMKTGLLIIFLKRNPFINKC